MELAAKLVLALAAIAGSARLFGALARRLGQPAVIGEILAGILLGPTLFAGVVTETLFPTEIRPSLNALASIGVCLFMFLVGLELDRGMLGGQARIAATMSLSAIIVPFGLGALLALFLATGHPTGNRLAFVLFLGMAMSVTALPVLARILTDRGLIYTPIGGLALACAAVGDVLAWSLLALVAALVLESGGEPWRVLLVIPYAAFMLAVLRPLLARRVVRRVPSGPLPGLGVLAAVSAGLLLSSWATEWMGLHAIFGAFLFGVTMPREGFAALRERALPLMQRACSVLLLPVFFVVAGSNVDLSRMDLTSLGELALILLVAIGGKFGGGLLGARLSGVRWRHAHVFAILINTRGLTELIVLTIGLQLAVLDSGLYSLMVVMALVTTAMTGVLLRWVYPPERVRQDMGAHHAAAVRALDPGVT